jgi:hypothetical protein
MQNAEVRMRRIAAVLLVAAAVAVVAGCDWLLGLDTTPPICAITCPADSAAVNGVVQIVATASDSVGVERVEFYADGTIVGTDSSVPYSTSWDASSLAEGSWHSVSCIAYDLDQNKGYSDTVLVVIAAAGQRSVYHGELDISAGTRQALRFDARAADTLAGDVQVVSAGALSSFMWLDDANYQKYLASQTYTALFRQDGFQQMSVRQPVPAGGSYYLVFANSGGSALKCWVRFVLE